MARQIIVLNAVVANGFITATAAFWLAAPANLTIPAPNFVSRVPLVANVPAWGATAAEVTALQAGTVLEQIFNTGQISAASAIAVETALQTAYTAAQAALTAQAASFLFVGSSWNGTTWTIV